MDHCPIHEKQVEQIEDMHVVMTQIANNVLWITNIGKWALATAGAILIIMFGVAANFNEKLTDVSISVKQSEVRIANLITDHDRSDWQGE